MVTLLSSSELILSVSTFSNGLVTYEDFSGNSYSVTLLQSDNKPFVLSHILNPVPSDEIFVYSLISLILVLIGGVMSGLNV